MRLRRGRFASGLRWRCFGRLQKLYVMLSRAQRARVEAASVRRLTRACNPPKAVPVVGMLSGANDMLKSFIAISGAAFGLAGCGNGDPLDGLAKDFYRTDGCAAPAYGYPGCLAHIDHGGAFGVTVGMDRNKARKAILGDRKVEFSASTCDPPSGYKPNSMIYANDPAIVNCVSKTRRDFYDSPGSRRTGWVTIYSYDGRVTKIEWGAGEGYLG